MRNNQTRRPTGADNPALEFFDNLLPDGGQYPAEDVMIVFDRDWENGGSVSHVAVIYLPRKYLKSRGYRNHPALEMVSSKFNRELFNSSSGNNDPDCWMRYDNKKSPPPHDPDTNANLGFGPDEDFQCLRAWGFSSLEEAERAIAEFARIRECAWARDGSIDPETLIKTSAARKSEAGVREIKRQIYAEEKERCLREFEAEVKRQTLSGEMRKCPKNVDMLFTSMLLNGHVAETNPGSLEFKEQWDVLREKMIRERDARIKRREGELLS